VSNLLLRSLRESGVLKDWAVPFARAKNAVEMARVCTESQPEQPRTVMVLDSTNTGDYWVVSEEDAQRLEVQGYTRYVTKPEQDPDADADADAEEQS
jgi:hypothetical protein